MDVTHQTDDEQTTLWNGRAGRAWVEAQELLDRMFKPFEDLLVEAVAARRPQPRARRRLRHGQHDARRRAAARREGPLRRHRHLGADDRRRAGPRRTRRARRPRFIRADAQTPRVRARELRHDHLALRRDVLRRLRPRLREPAARREARRRAAVRRLAQRRGESVHDDGRARRGAASAEPPARRPDAPGQFAFADRAGSTRSWRRAAGPRSTSGRSTSPARCPRRSWSVTSPGSVPSAESFKRRTSGLARRSSKRSAPPSIRTCTAAEVRFTAACWMVGARAPE